MYCLPVYTSHAYGACGGQNKASGIRSPRSRVTGGCEPPSENWELNLAPPKEQPVLFTMETSPNYPVFKSHLG